MEAYEFIDLRIANAEDMMAHEEVFLPNAINAYYGLEESGYYDNLAEEYEKEDNYGQGNERQSNSGSVAETTESDTAGTRQNDSGVSEVLQGEQSFGTEGTGTDSTGQESESGGTAEIGSEDASVEGNVPGESEVASPTTSESTEPTDKKSRLRKRAEGWSKLLGVKVNVIERVEDLPLESARKAKRNGDEVKGWYDPKTDEVYIFLPDNHSERDLDATAVHEAVAHYGLKKLLGEEEFNKLLDKVWESMSAEARAEYLSYLSESASADNVADRRAAADEYIAHIAEKIGKEELTEAEKTVWQSIIDFIKDLLFNKGMKVTDKQIVGFVKASYVNLVEEAKKAETSKPIDLLEYAKRKVAEQEQRDNPPFRKVYHGTGAEFDKFDHSFMGTGEGNQAFGWGTYVSEVEGVAKTYAVSNGRQVAENPEAREKFEAAKKEWDDFSNRMYDKYGASYSIKLNEQEKKENKALLDAFNAAKKEVDKYKAGRRLYTVEIPDDDGSNYINWREIVPKELENAVKARLYEMLSEGQGEAYKSDLKQELNDVFRFSDYTGRSLYNTISAYVGGDNYASKFLNEMGFVGIKYPVGTLSGSENTDASNYVIFNENDLQIEERVMFRKLSSSNKAVNAYDKEYGTDVKGFFDYLRNEKKGEKTNFYIANAGELLEKYGIKGKFMVGDFTFSNRHTDDEDHKLGVKEWVNVINNLNNPLAITSYKGLPNEYRIYTYATINGKNICLGVNVSLKDGVINLSRIISAYGRDVNALLGKEKVNLLYPGTIEELKRMISQGSTGPNSLLNAPSSAFGAKLENSSESAKGKDKKSNKPLFRKAKNANNLVAVHNISESNLRKVLETGGLIMPSIAITDVKLGHSGYGEISLLFDKETINPSDRRNKVYGGDAWTPRFPQMVPKLNGEVIRSVRDKVYGLLDMRLRGNYSLSAELHPSNIESTITNNGVEGYYNKEWMKIAYLLDNGKRFKVPMKMKDYGSMAEIVIKLAKERGLSLSDIDNGSYDFYKNNPDFVAAIQDAKNEQRLASVPAEVRDKMRGILQNRPISFSAFDTYINQALDMEYDLKNGGLKQVVDGMALYDAINKRVKTDNADYNKWVDSLFEGVVEKYGIRNNRDWYTPSGNSRPWEQLYDAATPANILRHMLAENEQGGSGGFWDSNIMGASAETYESIDEIREKGKKRLKRLDTEEYDEWSTSVANRMSEICDEFLTVPQKNDFGGVVDAKIAITDAVAKDKTAKGIYKTMKKQYAKFTMEHAKRVEEIVKEIQDSATTYFEAKPQRIVSLSEVRKAVVPSNVSSDIVDGLEKNGIEVATYRKGNEQSRNRVVKKESEGIRFRKANKSQEIFVSNARKAVEGIKQEKATPQQWLAMIQKQGGLKAGEDKWMGLSEWLNESAVKTLTKDEVLAFVDENAIKIEEVKYGEDEADYSEKLDVFNAEFEELMFAGEEETDSMYTSDWVDYAWSAMVDRYGDDFTNAFELEGSGTQARLVPQFDYDGRLMEAARFFLEVDEVSEPINSTRLDYTTDGLENKREIALTVPTIEPYNQSDDIHFGDAGGGRAVAWIRFGETFVIEDNNYVREVTELKEPYRDVRGHDIYKTDSGSNNDFIIHGKGRSGEMIYVAVVDGNQIPVAHKTLDDAKDEMNKYFKEHPIKDRKRLNVLVIDEIQSKRHQDGREKGYKAAEVEALFEKLLREIHDFEKSMTEKYKPKHIGMLPFAAAMRGNWTQEEKAKYEDMASKIGTLALKGGIPDAPFDKNWHELAMKRMLRLAAEEGFDKVAWTTGAQQAERYNMGSMVNSIEGRDYADSKEVTIYTPTGETALYVSKEDGEIYGEEGRGLGVDVKGKQLSEVVGKELAAKLMADGDVKLSGDGLSIGGEGMKGFYDKMLPSFVQKYVKKWGAKVGEVELPNLEESAQKMWSVDVTEQMKKDVMEGQVMFRKTPSKEELDAIRAEEAEIERKAKADGTWMKAPNGKPSNLSPRQWVQVRTKAFKKWFGDWEIAARIVRVVIKNSLVQFKNIAEAKQWAKQNIIGATNNPYIGDVNISGSAIDKYLSGKAVDKSVDLKSHFAALQALPELIENAVVGEIHEDRDGNTNIKDIVRLYGCLSIEGTPLRVKITVKRYYDQNVKTKAYSYEVTEIEPLDGNMETHTHSADFSAISNDSIMVAKLLDKVVNAKGFPIINSSKIVDENGEPLVVYHGTAFDFNEFDISQSSKSTGNHGWFGKGFYFAPNENVAKGYAKEASQKAVYTSLSKEDKVRWMEDMAFYGKMMDKAGENVRVMPVFLNIKNPQITDVSAWGDNFVQEDNTDGVVATINRKGKNEIYEIKANTPTQIKSATDNVGTFDGEEGDIRFRKVTDPKLLKWLEDEEKVEAYRAVQINEKGEIFSPMASRLKPTSAGTEQKKNSAAQMKEYDEAVENPDMVDEKGRIAILDEDGGVTKVSYNPYGHCCVNSMMNDQFKKAWRRDELYTMKVLVPKSELTSGYHADKAKDPVGVHKWKTGAVGNYLPESKRRQVLLTRWMKNQEVMTWEAVANDWIKTLEGEDIDVPWNCVPRKILNMLVEGGVKIVKPEKNMGAACEKAYKEWLADPVGYVGDTELPPHIKALNEKPDNDPSNGKSRKQRMAETKDLIEYAKMDVERRDEEVRFSKRRRFLTNHNLTDKEIRDIQRHIKTLPENYDTSSPLYFEKNGYIYKFDTSIRFFEENLKDGDGFEILNRIDVNKLSYEDERIIKSNYRKTRGKTPFYGGLSRSGQNSTNIPENGKGEVRNSELDKQSSETWKSTSATRDRGESRGDNGSEVDKPLFRKVTPAEDNAYMDAVGRGDIETAQRMVDKVLEDAGYTIRGEHGTTHKFTIFSNANANIENSFGKGYYFTNNRQDAEENYASDYGPDLTNRIELLAENMEFEDGYEYMDYDERLEEAKKRLHGGENRVISVALNMNNPCIFSIDPNGEFEQTVFDVEEAYDEETDEYGEPSGLLVDFANALNEVLSEGEYYGAERVDANELIYDGDYTADQLKDKVNEMLLNAEDEFGDYAGTEIFRSALERMGFDGIIDNAPSHRFRGMGLGRDTKHYIAFNPNKIKQSDAVTYDDEGNIIPLSNRADKTNPDIRFRFIGKKGAENLDKAEEATTRLDNLNIAREMEKADKDALSIKMATGWERGADKKWRYEVEDKIEFDRTGNINDTETFKRIRRKKELDAEVEEYLSKGEAVPADVEREYTELARLLGNVSDKSKGKLKDFVRMEGLYKEYPSLAELDFEIRDDFSANAYYDEIEKKIVVNEYLSEEKTPSVLIHEIQHAIQDIEGFAKGGNIKSSQPLIREIEDLVGAKNASLNTIAQAFDEGYIPQDKVEKAKEIAKAHGYDNVSDYVRSLNAYDYYRRLAGEVESRNVQKRLGMAQAERMASLAEETEDVARKDQVFLYDAIENLMGSRVDKRMAEIGEYFKGRELTEEQRAIVDVFSGVRNNVPISIIRKDGENRRVIMRQGNEQSAGVKHSIFRHYGTSSGYYTDEEVLLIEDVLKNGVRSEVRRRGVIVSKYKHIITGVTYTVLTEKKDNREEFADFYTNRSDDTRSSNTQLSARAGHTTASADKGSKNSSNDQKGFDPIAYAEQKVAEQDKRFRRKVRTAVHDVDSVAQDVYNKSAKGFVNKTLNAWVDYLRPVRKMQEAIARELGREKIDDMSNVYLHALHKSSVDAIQTESLTRNLINPYNEFLRSLIRKKGVSYDEIDRSISYTSTVHLTQLKQLRE